MVAVRTLTNMPGGVWAGVLYAWAHCVLGGGGCVGGVAVYVDIGVGGPGGMVQGMLIERQPSLVDRMTDSCKNITSLQTPFASCKYCHTTMRSQNVTYSISPCKSFGAVSVLLDCEEMLGPFASCL